MTKEYFLGYNGTVLAYGQTGSGKTYTMGSAYSKKSEKDEFIDKSTGVIPRAVKDIFKGIEDRSEDYEFVVKVWYAEVSQQLFSTRIFFTFYLKLYSYSLSRCYKWVAVKFAKAYKIARRQFCTKGHFCRADNLAQRHFCTDNFF